MTPEGAIQAYLKLRTTQTNGEFRKVKWEGRRGAPDCFIFWDGPIQCFVEVKTLKGRLRPLQCREIQRLRDAGFRVEVVRSKARVDELIAELLTARP